ncbi:alpha-L-rhamnosidase [Orenia metallireducens]|uniref:alpha-L-rhamnosidase n=1 Tax=Orenia metallireducens TaxID=1413210 RepID=A0A285HHX3_9FIRM|nr:alpha-L-rhamnosidase [Orenia metallireducens]PRX27201.1 alpha-L-rhamnosidase [Orenia metallireducens]SNY35315.1 alpha-L-rhamnosidase [Orenia metallireducens]
MKVVNTKINGFDNPIGFELKEIICSWIVEDTYSSKQEYAKIEVSLDESFSDVLYIKEGKDLSSIGELLEVELQPRTRYYYRVEVAGDQGDSAVSKTDFFETGKMYEAWQAEWIGTKKEDDFHPIFTYNFSTKGKVKKARIYICGLGLYEAYLNGEKIGDEYLAPFLSDYKTELQYQTYPITNQVQEENKIEVYVGKGWFMGKFGLNSAKNIFGSKMAVIAEIHLEYEDGSTELITTDENWSYCGSDIEDSNIYDGEIYNRCLWDDRDNSLKPVEIIRPDREDSNTYNMVKEHLVDRFSLPVIVKEEIIVKEVITTPKGETVLDMGQNFAGFIEFKSELPKGSKVVLDFGEVLQEGNFYNENYRDAKSQFIYISNGEEEVVRPHFTYFGFRYVRVTGWVGELDPSDFTGKVVYSDLNRTGFIETSDEKINQLYSNCLWGQKSNFIDMPTDCPQRSERLGWTGDAQVFAPTASYNMDTRAFYRKFLRDLRHEQKRMDGGVPNYIPNTGDLGGTSSAWGDAATFIPNTLFNYYGNIEEMKTYYPMMKDWVDYVTEEAEKSGNKYLYSTGSHFGDWLALDGVTSQSFKGGTEDYYIASVYYYRSAEILSEMAARLGKSEEAEEYMVLSEHIKEAILAEYFTPTGRLAIDTQTAYIIALKFGVYKDKARVIEQFRNRLQKDCYRIKCGFVGAPLLCTVLSENGMEDLAYDFLFQEEFPSWLYCVNLGATTIWERWNSILEDGTISGTGMNSLNHYAYGSVMEFIYAHVAGIRAAEPGFRKAVIEPKPNMKFKYVKCQYDSVSGTYVSNWEIKEDGKVHVHVEVPFNAEATLILPRCEDPAKHLGSGSYDFEYMPTSDYRLIYHKETRLEQLKEDEEAMEILAEKLPAAVGLIKSGNPEMGSKKLEDLYQMGYMGFKPEDIKATIDELCKLKRW